MESSVQQDGIVVTFWTGFEPLSSAGYPGTQFFPCLLSFCWRILGLYLQIGYFRPLKNFFPLTIHDNFASPSYAMRRVLEYYTV
jgi:hypothetical protein